MLALPSKSYAQLGLDSVENFAVYADGTETITGTATTVTGDVGLGNNGTQNFSSAFAINNGNYRVDPYANNSHPYSGSFTGGTVMQSLGYVSTNVDDVSTYAAGLPATANYVSITTGASISSPFSSTGGINVINVGTISINGNGAGRKLTLSGGPNDIFVLNVSNSVSFLETNWTPVVLSGGVTEDHVLFNLLNTSGSANALYVSNNVTLLGTFIAPDASMFIGSGLNLDGGLFAAGGGSTLTLGSGTVTADVFMLPEPSSFALVGISCLFSLAGLWGRRRTRR